MTTPQLFQAGVFSGLNQPVMLPGLGVSPGLYVEIDGCSTDAAHQFLQLVALRLLAASGDERPELIVVDLAGLGGELAFLSSLPDSVLSPENVITDDRSLQALLDRMLERARVLLQRRIGFQFSSLLEYNESADIPEPYVLMIIASYPSALSADSLKKLQQLVVQAEKTGTYILVAYDPSKPSNAFGQQEEIVPEVLSPLPRFHTFRPDGSCQFSNGPLADVLKKLSSLSPSLDVIHQTVPQTAFEELIASLVQESEALEKNNGDKSVAADGLRIRIGQEGMNPHFFVLGFNSGVYHALVGGETGSGKSVLLHNIITNSLDTETPDTLRLHLLDFKEGTEFKVYENHPLVDELLLETDGEQAERVLTSLATTITERGELFKSAGANSLTAWRARTGKPLPRILVIIDEFQKLFEGDYKQARQMNRLLEDLAKRGRSFGIHLVLSSQSLLQTAIEKTTLNQLGLRIVMRIDRSECPKFLAFENDAPSRLLRPGLAVYNDRRGAPEANRQIQVSFLSHHDIEAKLSTEE